jgi:hypothetical protein
VGWGEAQGADPKAGWHPPAPEDDPALLRAELDACRAEIERLRAIVDQLGPVS